MKIVVGRFSHTFYLLVACSMVALAIGCSGGSSDPLEEIRAMQAKNQFKGSLEPLRELLDENPDQPEANLLLGRALMKTREPSLAIWPLHRAIKTPEYAVESGLLLAQAMLASRTPRDALTVIEQVLALEPENTEALSLRAQCNLKAGRLESALADANLVFELDPENLSIVVPRALALIQLERIDEAEEALEYGKTLMETTEQRVDERTQGRLCVADGMFSYEKGDQEAAEAQFAACLEAYPTTYLVIIAVMNFYDEIGQKERATETLRSAFEVSQDPQFASALVRRMGNLGDEEEQERLLRSDAEQRPSSGTWFALGDFYALRERYEEACTAFEQAVEAERNPAPMVRLAYADTLIQAGRFEDAERATAQIEDESFRALLKGRILLGQGDPRGALESFESGIKLWPNNPTARFLAAEAAERLGDFDRAISEYRESIRSDAKKTEAGCRLGRLLSARGAGSGARIAFARHIEVHKTDGDCVLMAIRLSHREGGRNQANRGLRHLASIPGHAPVALAERIAIIAAGAGPEVAANAGLNTNLDLMDPLNATALRALLHQLAVLEQHDKAKELVDAALEANPDAAAFHTLQAQVLRASGGSTEQIRASLEAAIERDPEYAEALADMASLMAANGEIDAAIAMYDRAAAADPANSRAVREATALLESNGKLEEAERRLNAHLETSPLDAWAASHLARILVAQGEDLDQALDFAKRADYFTTDPEAPETLGWVLLLRGEAEPAVKALTRAVERRPEASSALYRLGLAYAAESDEANARELFLRVIEVGAPEAEKARAEIARLDAATG